MEVTLSMWSQLLITVGYRGHQWAGRVVMSWYMLGWHGYS